MTSRVTTAVVFTAAFEGVVYTVQSLEDRFRLESNSGKEECEVVTFPTLMEAMYRVYENMRKWGTEVDSGE